MPAGKRLLALAVASVLLVSAAALPVTSVSKAEAEARLTGKTRKYGDSWSDCGQGATELSLRNVTMSPFPVQVGKDFTLTLDTVNDNAVITGGAFKTEVYLVGVPVYSETDDLCSKHECPLAMGNVTLGITTFLPNTTPPGWYSLTIRGTDQDGLPTLCADIKFTISPWKQ
mmetsp:Transcript_9185/g.24089  ORF Transcript_9185/g.24089 Transcript_9185/m.24089 type:complete len:171 (-) Transcript_9185:105-617(-)|eukprot:CAMPEP_0174951414 /NCGR_PEP_ID=MMETSP1355-20121228/94837_1 /TAXON_ID=464990 /ORGANISM="Hemiselmis tepida, Strain CCMP443" /LENGTH=170 /DNA_ID=CAMNT_0016199069 /DNA_START=304 /DNA_END=816 /DNA_ORIENTATION=-